MGIEDEILDEIESQEAKEILKDSETKTVLTASDIQKQRRDFEEKIRRKKNLANVPADKQKRHAVIQAIMDSNELGEEPTPVKVQKALKDHGLDVSLVTVCKDLTEIRNINPETMKKVDSTLVGKLKSYLSKLEEIAETNEDADTKIKAINAAFDDTKKLYDILDEIATRSVYEESEKAKLRQLGHPINEIIQFIDSPEKINKDMFYNEERDLIIEWLNKKITEMMEKESKVYEGFSSPFALNTLKKTVSDIIEIIKSLNSCSHRKPIQQEKEHSNNNIKIAE